MWGRLTTFFGIVLMAMAFPSAATASDGGSHSHARYSPNCFSYGELGDPIAELGEKPPAFWNCSGEEPSLKPDRVYLRFALNPEDEAPDVFVLRRIILEAVHTAVFDEDGSSRVLSFSPDQLTDAGADDMVRVRLPEITEQSRQVVVTIDRATHRIVFEQAELGSKMPETPPEVLRDLIIKSVLAGFLLMPLIFNLVVYRVLRETFVLWHAGLTASFAVHIFIVSGMLNQFVTLGFNTLAGLHILTFGACVCGALMFARSMMETEGLNPKIKEAMLFATIWVAQISIVHSAFPFIWRAVKTDFYYLAFLPVLAVIVWMIWDGLRNGSRAAKYIAIGWAPVVVVGLLRLLGQLTPLIPPTDAMLLLHIGAVAQVTATAFGVADRFMVIRNQRDEERRRTGILEEIAEQDPLTGLFNRRAIDQRFEQLHSEGYSCFALLDLDRFKTINDRFGHMMGDEVLRQVAKVLKGDDDTIAIRMGGEEFMLLMRGEGTENRAEAIRQAIPLRLAREIDGLDRIVTASMGMITVPRAAMPKAQFGDIYSRADMLLYDAKVQGRNRTVSERFSAFAADPSGSEIKAA